MTSPALLIIASPIDDVLDVAEESFDVIWFFFFLLFWRWGFESWWRHKRLSCFTNQLIFTTCKIFHHSFFLTSKRIRSDCDLRYVFAFCDVISAFLSLPNCFYFLWWISLPMLSRHLANHLQQSTDSSAIATWWRHAYIMTSLIPKNE